MRPEDITFRLVDAEIDSVGGGAQNRTIEVVEIRKPDGNQAVFPADAVNDESGKRYCDLFPAKYAAFKNNTIDPDRKEQLTSEIAQRQAELDAPANRLVAAEDENKRRRGDHGGHQGVIHQDKDKDNDKDSARSAADHDESTSKPDFANMSEAKLRLWIANNGGDEQRNNASRASLISTAEELHTKAERKKARAGAASNK